MSTNPKSVKAMKWVPLCAWALSACQSPQTLIAPPAATAMGTESSSEATAESSAQTHYTAIASHAQKNFPSSRAVDGNLSTEWGSGFVQQPTLILDWGKVVSLQGIQIKMNTGVGTYTVDVSVEGTRYWTVASSRHNSSWSLETKKFAKAAQVRYTRLKFQNQGKQVLVFEVRPILAQRATPQPSPTATAKPTPTPTVTAAPATGAAIVIRADRALHKATSHILGTNRNHVASDFPKGAAKLAKLRELQPTWGERKYLYRIGHGPTDGRWDYGYMTGYHFESVWNKKGGYPYDDIRESLKDANALGADQMHVINFGTGTPEEAGRYVSYLNRSTDPNRKIYPYAQQNAKLFELGNEIAWKMVRGHEEHARNEVQYAERAKRFAQEMRANSDVPIQIGAVASINSNWEGNGWSGGATTVKNILSIMDRDVDFLIYHGYPSWPMVKWSDLQTILAQNEWNRQKLEREIKPAIRQYAPGRDVFIANTEFFTHQYNDPTRSRGMFGALYSADTLTLAMNQDIRTSVQFCMEHKDLADAAFFIGNDPERTTAIFKFQKMLAQHWGDEIVESGLRGVGSLKVTSDATSIDLPRLAVAAARSGKKVFVLVTHRTQDEDVKASLDLGFTPASVTAYELSGGAQGWNADNAIERTLSNPSLKDYVFKRATITLFEIVRK